MGTTNPYILGGLSAAPAYVLTEQCSGPQDTADGLWTATSWYYGDLYIPATSYTLTKVDISLSLAVGDVSGFNYYVEVWSVNSGTGELVSSLASSNLVAGNNSWAGTWVSFIFNTGAALTSGNWYSLICRHAGATSNTNYVSWTRRVDAQPGIVCYLYYWMFPYGGAFGGGYAYSQNIKFYKTV